MNAKTFSTDWAGRPLTIEVGRMAHQADAACTVRYGDTMVLATVVVSKEERPGLDFFPLMVDYEEKYYAAGKIKGSRFIKMEGRPSDQAVLSGRMIDRMVRPLFDERMRRDVQIIVSVLSYDEENNADMVAMVAACTVLHMSHIPWKGPVAGVRVGRKGESWMVNPTVAQQAEAMADLVVCGTPERLIMMEADAKQVPDETMVEGVAFGLKQLAPVLELMEQVRVAVGREKDETLAAVKDAETRLKVEALALPFIAERVEALFYGAPLANKVDRAVAKDRISHELKAHLIEKGVAEEHVHYGTGLIYDEVQRIISQQILKSGRRVDGRALEDIRPLGGEVGLLPRTHGSGLFMRGETQVLSTVTLAGPGAAQIVDTMDLDIKKSYMHHYSFPPFSVGETRPLRGPGRREIGHGALAEKALISVLPSKEKFPYVIRVTSDTLGSNGSSSMGSVCGSTLALMDAGVPILAPVAGVAVGLASVSDMSTWKVFTDLQDLEDGKGGMDFKIAGTAQGITAIQLDTKTIGLSMDIVTEAFRQAKQGRLRILDVLKSAIATPRPDLSKYAPRIESFYVKPDRIRDIIGPGGKMINEIIDKTGVDIDIEDSGLVVITSKSADGMRQAVEWVRSLTAEVEVGKTYHGTVTRLMDFGAFVEVLPKQEGLVHVSEMAPYRVNKVTDIVKAGDKVFVKLTEVDSMGRLNLSMKQAEGNVFPPAPAFNASAPSRDDRPRRDPKPRFGHGSKPPHRP
ncbi:MAG: polyribonucleotide nucleotidyltransferase [Patescibacteria group bacterium]